MNYLKAYQDDEDMSLPQHISHSRDLGYYSFDSRYNHEFYRWLRLFLKKSVGKTFGYVYNKVRRKHSHTETGKSPLEIIREYTGGYNRCYFDDNGILKCKPK